jgi:hypothetical protein
VEPRKPIALQVRCGILRISGWSAIIRDDIVEPALVEEEAFHATSIELAEAYEALAT